MQSRPRLPPVHKRKKDEGKKTTHTTKQGEMQWHTARYLSREDGTNGSERADAIHDQFQRIRPACVRVMCICYY